MSHARSSPVVKCAVVVVSVVLLGLLGSAARVEAKDARTCEGVNEEPLVRAIADARQYIAKSWTTRGPDWITVYDTPEIRRNPFAPKKDEAGASAIHGWIWARGVRCTVSEQDTGVARLKFTATAFRFRENGNGWTKPQKNGVIVALEATLKDGNWLISDKSAEQSVLLPEGVLRPLRTDELPDPKLWLDKQCKAPSQWQGGVCTNTLAPP